MQLLYRISRRTYVFLTLMIIILALYPAVAQDAMTEWGEETSEAGALTLLWQTEFTAETVLPNPGDIAIDSWGNVYASTQDGNTIKKFDSDGNFLLQWGARGTGDGQFTLCLGVAVDAQDNVYVTDFYNIRIQKFDSEGNFLMSWPNESTASPAFIGVDAAGNVYVNQFPSHDEHYIHKFDSSGALVSEWGAEGGDFSGITEDIAVDADGNVYVADPSKYRVQKLNTDGELVLTFGGERGTEGNGLFDEPFGVSVDGDGNVYVLDNNFLQKFDWEGNFLAQWSIKGGDLDRATNVAVDADGNIYVFARADVIGVNGDSVNVPVLKKFAQS